MMSYFSSRIVGLAILALVVMATSAGSAGLVAQAQDVTTSWKKGLSSEGYPQQTGEGIYKAICQGCHMPDAKGAVGAGSYPALAGNERLQAVAYPLSVVANGQRAMPSFGESLTDSQIVAVVNYVRSHFGNRYADAASVAAMKAIRRVGPGKDG
jgi:mono/diheme cytochrome c family protein